MWGQKWAKTASKLKFQKLLSGEDIRQNEIKMGPHRRLPKGWSTLGGQNFNRTIMIECYLFFYKNDRKIEMNPMAIISNQKTTTTN